jgi:cytochrome b561/polyisoprenoid-binding protein YceI
MTAAAHDSQTFRAQRYSTVAVAIHWLTVAAILIQLVLAWRMHGPRSPETFAVFQLHKSVGISILLLSLLRLGWRLANPPPPLPATLAPWERWLARLTHVGFYVILIVMPLTGWLMVSTSPLRLPTLLYGTVPWPDLPGLAGLSAATRKMLGEAGEVSHSLLALGLLGLLALHVGGALKHQLFDRDNPVLGRMLPGVKPGRWLEPRLWGAAAALAVIVVLALVLPPPMFGATPVAAAAATPMAAPALAVPEASAPAAPVAAATTPVPAAAAAEPARWAVAPGSSLNFETSWGGQAIQGHFDKWTGEILFSPEALDRSRVKVTIDLSSAKTGDAQRDASIAGEDWFDVAAHPAASFTADRFEAAGPDRYRARGKLTLRGVTKDVVLPFRLKIDGDTARASGVTSLDRTAFGVGQGEWKSTDQIPAKVTVSLDVKARRR